ncbi:MAE_28990/MAE_18760 family HEPN-like nuclease [Cyanobacterium aponinum AL20118]|uniref:MAE-28990/MAE-18760-like HEPN domain-containing protein n=2 Tax=Cyanobacterium aponinum TaxID=379064 RepID=K9YZ76_CYAAP|nr:MAE_28990/MAE_18760 family HEPN-like nuclease [Cyanobacterium aponinum]AFZ52236.1 hypothetical protein Cyan10605_0075 [Cyanobacterium aponinum PCC 10605]WPF88768.1 MAE_28990/MAE_18760 family HEPN-like nuclease [Cyanobacterium aponinum AL20115]
MNKFIQKLQNLLDKVDNNIQSIKEITTKNQKLTDIIFGNDSTVKNILKENNQLDLTKSSVGFDQWKRYQHCSVITQLYAIYEDFVEELISIWIDNLPNIFEKYSDLGMDFQKQYILGIAKLIKRLNRNKYPELKLEKLINIPKNTNINYKLVQEVFTDHQYNLRMSELNKLLDNAGIKNTSDWLQKSNSIQQSISSINSNQTTVEKELQRFINYRNDASHNIQQDNILNFNELIDFCNFINTICFSLHDLILYQTLERMIALNKIITLGQIRQYRDKLKSARLKVNNSILLSVGLPTLLVKKETSICKFAKIEKISIVSNDQYIEKEDIKVPEKEQDIWIQFNIDARKNWTVYIFNFDKLDSGTF